MDEKEERIEDEFDEVEREEPVKESDSSNDVEIDSEGTAGKSNKSDSGDGGKSNKSDSSHRVNMTGSDDKPLLGIDAVKTEYKEEPDALFDNKKHDNSDIKKIQEGQMKWAMLLMAAILIIVVVVPFVKFNYVDKFDYHGLTFQKTQLGDLEFYSTQFPVVVATGEVIGSYSVNLRTNPKELDKIPLTTRDGRIEFTLNDGVFGDAYITLNPFMELCEDSGIAMASLSGFLKDSNLNVISAVSDKAYARDNNMTQRWCNSAPTDTMFYVTDGNDTMITEIMDGCYELQFNDCEILQVSERAILKMLEQYGESFKIQ